MRIAFVVDDMSQKRNGTTMSALRYAQVLRSRGHEVRLVGYGARGEDSFWVDRCHYPVVDWFASKQGFIFGEPDEAVFARAFDGVDIVHLYLPFKLEQHALAFARSRSIPVSAAFHLQPENMTYNANLYWMPGVAWGIYTYFRRRLFDRVRHVHCPSQLIADDLTGRYGYRAQMHVISNGVNAAFGPAPSARPFDDGLFHIATVGRLAREKDQKTLLNAVMLSRHADKIMVHIAGAGPLEPQLRKLGNRLPVPPRISFCSTDELVELLRACDLYVHCSVVDSEAISCIEAFGCGLVPVISNSPLSATHQFALDARSLYQARDARELAQRIDYWFEHPVERARMAARCAQEGRRYRIDACVDAFLAMEEAAVADDRDAYGAARAARPADDPADPRLDGAGGA